MADQQLTYQHRALVLQRLAELEQETARIATWLAQLDGEDRAAEWLEDAWKSLSAAGWALERRGVTPLRAAGS